MSAVRSTENSFLCSHSDVVGSNWLYRTLFILCTTFIYTICVYTVQNGHLGDTVRVDIEKRLPFGHLKKHFQLPETYFDEDVSEVTPVEMCWQSMFAYCTVYVLFI